MPKNTDSEAPSSTPSATTSPSTPAPTSSRVPTPVAAALGLVPTVVEGVRRIPTRAATLPLMAVSTALSAVETVKTQFDGLATRGEQLVGQWRGEGFDGLEDKLEDRLAKTRLAKPYDKVEDALEDVSAATSAMVSKITKRKKTETVTETEAPEAPEAQRVPAPAPDTAATPEVVETVEAVAEMVDAPSADEELPLPDYDHMTLGSLRGRLRSLTIEQLVQVREYEKAHAHRLPVVTLLDNRIAKLATDDAATPSAGGGEDPVLPAAPEKVGKVTGPSRAKTSTPAKGKVRLT